jgi:hypothetical protein
LLLLLLLLSPPPPPSLQIKVKYNQVEENGLEYLKDFIL